MKETKGTDSFTIEWSPLSDCKDDIGGISYQHWIWIFIILGVVLRTTRYLLVFPLWGDEAMVAVNFLDRSYLGLSKPLDYHQICPILFLWIELGFVKLVGFSELSLRFFPTICSIAGVFLFHHIAIRILQSAPALLAVGIFCVSYYPIRHGAEIKPYACDLFITLILFTMVIEWYRKPEKTSWLWALIGFVPFALAISYPAVFTGCAVGITLLGLVYKLYRKDSTLK